MKQISTYTILEHREQNISPERLAEKFDWVLTSNLLLLYRSWGTQFLGGFINTRRNE